MDDREEIQFLQTHRMLPRDYKIYRSLTFDEVVALMAYISGDRMEDEAHRAWKAHKDVLDAESLPWREWADQEGGYYGTDWYAIYNEHVYDILEELDRANPDIEIDWYTDRWGGKAIRVGNDSMAGDWGLFPLYDTELEFRQDVGGMIQYQREHGEEIYGG